MDRKYLCLCFLQYQRTAQLEIVSFHAESRTAEETSAGAQGDFIC